MLMHCQTGAEEEASDGSSADEVSRVVLPIVTGSNLLMASTPLY